MQKKCAACREDTALPFEFKIAFQPIVDLSHDRVWGYEALVRGPNGESAASILGQVNEDNRYRFDQTARVMAIETAGALFKQPDLRLSINFMPNAVYEPSACIQKSLAAAKRANFPHRNLMFELPKTSAWIRPLSSASSKPTAISASGQPWTISALAMPDWASLRSCSRTSSKLIELLRDIHLNAAKRAIVGGVAGIARELNITVLAEGVENANELAVLRAAGISLFQGYHFAKPALMSLPPVQGLRGEPAAAVQSA